MCFYSKISQDALKVANRYKARFIDESLYIPKNIINGFEHSANPLITNEDSSLIQFYNWGIIPEGTNDINIRRFTLNARIETINSVSYFKKIAQNRCIIPSDGFYEWKHISGIGKIIKERYLIYSTDYEIFSFAGLYSKWVSNKGSIFNTYTILTTQANKLMSEIHNSKKRMPVILKPEDELLWLNGANSFDFAYPYEIKLSANKI